MRTAANSKGFDALEEAGGISENISELISQTGAEYLLIGIVTESKGSSVYDCNNFDRLLSNHTWLGQ